MNMKIGLVRHFKVLMENPPKKQFLTQSELLQWLEDYDRAEVQKARTNLGGIQWEKCFSSDMPRAVTTASVIYDGIVIQKDALRELKLYPVFKKDRKLPFLLWPLIIRIAWIFNHKSQISYKTESLQSVKNFVDEILSMDLENILIVSHGALMHYLRKELVKRGFKGPRFTTPENGELYVFENDEDCYSN